MKLILLLLCLLIGTHAHIYSSQSKVTYDYFGNPLIYHIFFSLQTGLGADDYIKITLPLKIHSGTDKSVVKVKLISFSNNLQLVSKYCVKYPTSSVTSDYYIIFGSQLTAGKWYEVQLFPDTTPAVALPFNGLIQIQLLSSLNGNAIIYDSNYAFRYISINAALASSGTMGVTTFTTSVQANRVASIYTIIIELLPGRTNPNGGNFTLKIHYDSANLQHTDASATGLLDFTFMGLCQSVAPTSGSGSAALLNFCQISNDLTSITFSVNSVTAGQYISIQTQISNPLYVSKRGIRAHYVDFISGIVVQNGYIATPLIVSPIAINDLGNTRVYLLWGISTQYTDSQLTPLGLGLYKATGSNVGPFNSFNAGFSFSQTSPIDGRYRVKMFLGATGFLQGSVAHNLPAYSNLKVYCAYSTSTKYLVCQNVGPFINTGYRYFISGKVFYNSGAGSSVAGFGNVQIIPIVYDSTGVQLTITLYSDLLSGDTITLTDSKQYLDTSGFHDVNNRKIGVAKIVSFQDDGTLSSTANAIKGFMTGTNSTVGIVPDLGVSQQLLLLMKVDSVAGGSGSGNQFKMRMLYNNKVIGFQTGGQQRGLDFVAYENATGNWTIQLAPCHISGSVVCQKYNYATPTKNIQVRNNGTNGYNFYGLYKFDCGDAYVSSAPCASGNCATACNLFTGYGTANSNAGVMSMRKVTFPSTQFHSSLYADDGLLDFLVIFLQGTGFVSASLINAYTMVGAKMQNIKASYVNYHDYSSTVYNKGDRMPTMIRIGGGVLPKQSRNATVIGVFFDDNLDGKTFYTYKNKAYDVGCSTGSCLYYPNTGINLPNNDIWHTMQRVQFYNIPAVQNQFNLLVPITPAPNRFTYDGDPLPDTLTIAFFSANKSIGDATGLLQTLSVYRLFGTAIAGSISGGISNINGLGLRSSNVFGTYFIPHFPGTYLNGISYALNVSNIITNPPNNTFVYGYGNSFTITNQFGCGVTISSTYYNIFESSTLAFETPPANTATTCSTFGYIYNEQTSGQNLERDGQWIYIAFCPIDSTYSLSNADANIKFINPQYPKVFSNGHYLRGIIMYGVSQPNGQLVTYRADTGLLTNAQSCTTAKLHAYNPSSSGKQRATFTVSTPQIRMSSSTKYDGYSQFRAIITLPALSTNIAMQGLCQVSINDLSCSVSVSSLVVTVTLTYIGSSVITITYFQLQLYAITSGTLTAGDYSLTIQLPQYSSTVGIFVPFGNSYSSPITYCTCTSNFKIGNTAYGTGMIFQAPVTTSRQKNTKSQYTFNFGSYDYRQAFFVTTSYYKFNFGFLTDPSNTDRSTRNNFRCLVYQNNAGILKLSTRWDYLLFSSFSDVRLYSKKTIDQPKDFLFTLGCYGSSVPTMTNTSNMMLSWMDTSSVSAIQTATDIVAPTTYTTAAPTSTLAVTLTNKRFNTQGMKAFYSFSLTSTQALTQSTRIYFNFHFKLSSKLDNEGYVQCYLRSAAAISDTAAIFTYCQFSQDRQLVIWNNLAVAASTTIYIDIYNIQLPKSTDTSPNAITISVDNDGDYSNGVAETKLITDTAAGGNSISDIIITSASVSTNYIRTPQTITISFNTVTNILNSGSLLYLMLPAPYAQWLNRGQSLTTTDCFLQGDNVAGTNRLSACQFISKRILKMTLSAATATNLHTLRISNIYSPSKIPEGRYNQYRFKLFMSTDNTQSDIIRFSFTDYSKFFTLIPDATLIDLSWKYYDIAVSDSLVTLTDISSQTFIIYIGYFSNVIQLRQSTYPNNFILEMNLALTSHPSSNFIHKDGLTIELGYKNSYFRIAASSLVPAGLYTLQYSKSGDTNNKYTAVPPLTIVVSNKQCKLSTKQVSYPLPRGGSTIPIVIAAQDCIPITGITITPSFSSSQVVMNSSLSSIVLTPLSKDGQLYIVASHTANLLAIGDVVTVTFAITGANALNYATIPSITLSIIDPAPYQTLPTATALVAPTLSYNKATFLLQCNMASKIYWGLGIYPSILNTQVTDFQARIISDATGLMTNFTQPEDTYMRVYGINYVLTTQTLSKTVYNLKSNAQYIFKYYCINQMGLVSDSQSYTFNSLNYGAYLMKVFIIFRGSITYGQYNDLACSLALNFQVPHNRLMTEAMSICGGARTAFYASDSDKITNQGNSDGQYVYNFYVLPDYNIPIDYTNANIRSALTLSATSTTIITSTTNFANLPELIQIQTQDIQFYTSPVMSLGVVVSNLNSIIVSASITNMNGFIVIGCMDGVFDATTMPMPTAALIKKGLRSASANLLKVKMQYLIQNYNFTMEFSTLTENKQYTFFYFVTVEDPQIAAQSTPVAIFNAKTLQAVIVDINYLPHTTVMGIMVALLVLILV